MFYGYAALGLASAAIYLCLPHAHIEQRPAAAPLKASRGVVYKLAALFSLDAFAGALSSSRCSHLAVPALRHVADGGECLLFLVELAKRFFLSSCGMHCETISVW